MIFSIFSLVGTTGGSFEFVLVFFSPLAKSLCGFEGGDFKGASSFTTISSSLGFLSTSTGVRFRLSGRVFTFAGDLLENLGVSKGISQSSVNLYLSISGETEDGSSGGSSFLFKLPFPSGEELALWLSVSPMLAMTSFLPQSRPWPLFSEDLSRLALTFLSSRGG